MEKSCETCKYESSSANRNPCAPCDGFKLTNWESRGILEKQSSDGSTASYYELPEGATELQHLISHRNMNGQIAEIFRACYRYGIVEHSPKLRDIKKIIFYANAELERLEKYGE